MQVSDDFLQQLFTTIHQNPASEIAIDLEQQSITNVATGDKAFFDINQYKKTCFINGYDDIDYLLSMKSEIEVFESTH